MAEHRLRARGDLVPPTRSTLLRAPDLWRDVCNAKTVQRAGERIHAASDKEIADCFAARLSLLTQVIRLAGARVPERSVANRPISAAHAATEAQLLGVVERLLSRGGVCVDQQAPWAELQLRWPPIVAAANYDFARVVDALLAAGADPLQPGSDGDDAVHVALLRPSALARLVRIEPAATRRACLAAEDRKGSTPLIACLASPAQPATTRRLLEQASELLVRGGASISDRDYETLRRKKKLHALCGLVRRLHPMPSGPEAYTLTWAPAWNWSFPERDRHTIRLTCLLARRGRTSLPEEIWSLVFSHCERGWFAPAAPPAGGAVPIVGAAAAAQAQRAVAARRAQIM
jgi:hypothetical protein